MLANAADELVEISQTIGETAASRTEPDVIVVQPEVVAIGEAKYRSRNDRKPADYRGFPRYLRRDDIYRVNASEVAATCLYELIRNWRIGCELAERLGRPRFGLINIGPNTLESDLVELRTVVKETGDRRVIRRSWRDLLSSSDPDWLLAYGSQRRLFDL